MDLQKLKDFIFFSENFFKIRKKSGEVDSFILNRAQLYIHERLEAQLKSTGKIRAIILKGRQQGCSTYVQARYFHKTITNRGIKTFILTHEAAATKNLFEMTKRLYENLPAGLCPMADKDSVKELNFSTMDSGYAVGTAGNRGAGRSQTIQLLHGSEVAYWPHADEHAMGLMQAIGSNPGTEIILESTANGIGNYYHSLYKGAEQGLSEYQTIFVPWYWQPEYTVSNQGFRLSDEEEFLLDTYKDNGMTQPHVEWRRMKIAEFGGQDYEAGLIKFNVEYPITSTVAFRNPVDDTFVNSKFVDKARNAQVVSEFPLTIGVDPAIGNNDRTAIIRRRGRKAYDLTTLRNHNTMELAGHIRNIIQTERPAKVFIDCIGIGAGVVDRLLEMGFGDIVEGVNVARSANDKERFANLRAELWWEMRDWLMGEMDVQIPDTDELHADLCSLGYKHKSNGQLLIESKDELRKRGMPSCDTADALMLTFFLGQNSGTAIYTPTFIPEHHQKMFI